jgi:hypothetical protein
MACKLTFHSPIKETSINFFLFSEVESAIQISAQHLSTLHGSANHFVHTICVA